MAKRQRRSNGPGGRAPARVVVKAGTNLLTGGTDRLDVGVMARIVAQIAALVERGTQVSLGLLGRHRRGAAAHQLAAAPKTIPMRQILAAIGQSKLHAAWDELFGAHGVTTAQALLTRGDLSHRLSYLNARNTLIGLMEMGVVPIVNENDVVATDEIRETQFGDNDKLSALVAGMLDAHVLVFLTDIGGLYTVDPARDAEAELIPEVRRITDDIERLAGESSSGRGIGGMVSKIKAAETATSSGTDVVIVDGRRRMRCSMRWPAGVSALGFPHTRIGWRRGSGGCWRGSATAGRSTSTLGPPRR